MPSDAERDAALVRRLAEALRGEHRHTLLLRGVGPTEEHHRHLWNGGYYPGCRTCDLLREAEGQGAEG